MMRRMAIVIALAAPALLAAAPAPKPWDAQKAAWYRDLTTKHVQKMVEKLRNRGQVFRTDGLPDYGTGDALCLPCHTLTPGTARSLTPIHITMIRGMTQGLTDKAPKDIRAPLCVDCHAYAYPKATDKTRAEIAAGDLVLDSSNIAYRRPCLQPECHTDRDFPWALKFLGHMKEAVPMIPNDELFVGNTRYETLGVEMDGMVGRSTLKLAGSATPWVMIVVLLVVGYRAILFFAERSKPSEEPADE